MTKNEALQDLKNALHVSHSQLFTYLNCSLKYRFMYVEARPQERISIALPFGKSIHASLERQYRVMKENQRWEPLGVLLNYFEHHINLELAQTDIPLLFKKETPDRDAVIDMGVAMLKAFHEGVDLTGFEILEIERPLSARLYTDEGQPTDLKLIGVLDLVLKDEAGRTIAVEPLEDLRPDDTGVSPLARHAAWASARGDEPAWPARLRREAAASFAASGLPHTRLEEWR